MTVRERMMPSSDSKKVIVIGAGIAGLTAAIYAKRSGFDVTVFEKHVIPGGLCTSWSRKGYLFEGGMHWLTGSSDKMPLFQVWKEIGALRENNPIYLRDPFYTLINGEKRLFFYRNPEKLRSHFFDFAPEDKKMIEILYRDIKKFSNVHMLVSDIPFLKAKRRINPGFLELMKMIPAGTRYFRLSKMHSMEYIGKFKNENIRHLLCTIIGARYNALSLIYTMASFASGDSGYPEGGSVKMANNMLDTFKSLGGNIEYRKEVIKIVIENKKVKGVIVKGSDEIVRSDAVIVTEDSRKAIDTLFEKDFSEPWAKSLRKNLVTEQNMFVCLGIKADLKDYPRGIVYPLKEPFEAGGLYFNELRINNYALYENHAPKGCTSLTCLLLGDSYEYWKKAKADGSYKEKKMEIAQRLIKNLEKFIPEINGNVEVIDVATPLTYERYTNSFEGSWMTVLGPNTKFENYPIKSKSVKGLYFAGQRQNMPGGLPIAAATGRLAAENLCKDNKRIFINI